eukprot:gnl/Ergobibamus_cyprinoides/1020.p1 GENE.gnl/Ergobibamus_cyprinoides/1020~~gnl/Ergobibamus_cyprinoides/1020.p1  ORF type:complete len:197 (-),score=66.55 gnl/Ergobibamus_cyprinoides/1020:14-604(-)
MQKRYSEAADMYAALLPDDDDQLLDIPAVVLANLCVAYVMLTENVPAEQLMRRVDRAEEARVAEDPAAQPYHLCIVNLAIGVLYCVKGNSRFGIQRVVKSLDPIRRKLGPDTWHYAKLPLLHVCDQLAKQMIVLPDSVVDQIVAFLTAAAEVGKKIPTTVTATGTDASDGWRDAPTIGSEARAIKLLLLKAARYEG